MSIWTNWDPLEEVIVGDCYAPGDLDWLVDQEARHDFNIILKETKEDLDHLSNLLTKLGVTVHRPNVTRYTHGLDLSSFYIQNPTAPIVPRDQYFVYGNTVFQTYTSMPDRYLDSVNYYSIFKKLFDQGHNWLSLPPPILNTLKETDKWWSSGNAIYNRLHNQLLWHTATMFKCGDAIIVNSWGPGTQAGFEWVRRNLPEAQLISNINNTKMNNWGHIDHGFFMTDDNTVFCQDKSWVPKCLQHKTIYEVGPLPGDTVVDDFLKAYAISNGKYSSDWIAQWKGYDQPVNFDTNVLVVDSTNVIFSSKVPVLFDIMESKGITCHVAPQRHGAYWEGGVHCLTLDVKRRGIKRKIVNELAD
jgi:hypothetical protein